MTIPEPPHSGRAVLRVENLTKSYGGDPVIDDLSLSLARGERLAVVGPNGAGKSTLLRLFAARTGPDSGTLTYGTGVAPGFFSQDDLEAGGSQTVLETVEAVATPEARGRLRDLLGAFLFRGDDIHKPVSVLSGGETSRLALLKLLLCPLNLLILDEPTNHLDLATKDILLESLQGYGGTLVFVSHDRAFIQALASRVLELRAGEAHDYPGDYEYYLWRTRESESSQDRDGLREHRGGEAEPAAPGHVEYEEAKRRKAVWRRLKRQEADLVERIEELEREARNLELSMAREEVYTDGERMRRLRLRIGRNQEEREDLHRRWEEVEGELAEIEEPE